MIKATDLEISDQDAAKMPLLFQQLRKAYREWKCSGRLPSGEFWQPPSMGMNNESRETFK